MSEHPIPTDIAWMVMVALLWAICFPFIVIGLPDAPPLLFAALRAFLPVGCSSLCARHSGIGGHISSIPETCYTWD